MPARPPPGLCADQDRRCPLCQREVRQPPAADPEVSDRPQRRMVSTADKPRILGEVDRAGPRTLQQNRSERVRQKETSILAWAVRVPRLVSGPSVRATPTFMPACRVCPSV